ncbi:MAG: ATP synthase F0 subunit B [Desulfatibacillaceae bacterium]|nr:ATP synthase F0 subunit B [Desulfatibacillaceae bacterium]
MTKPGKKPTESFFPGSRLFLACALAFFLVLATASPAFASDAAGWRGTYDVVMLWINFCILVFLLVKFLRKPLMGFLGEQRKLVEDQLEKLEKRRLGVIQEMAELNEKIAARDKWIIELVEQTRLQAEQERKQIVDDARAESTMLMENAKIRIQARILETKLQLREELLELAMDIAINEIPRIITSQDQDRLLGFYMENAFAPA